MPPARFEHASKSNDSHVKGFCRGAHTSQRYTGPGGWFQLSRLSSFLELLENMVKPTKMIIMPFFESIAPSLTCVPYVSCWENLLETWFLLGDGSWWTPSQPSMQPMQQNAVLPPGGSMPQMMQTLVCRCVKTKIQVGEGWSLEVSSGKTLNLYRIFVFF